MHATWHAPISGSEAAGPWHVPEFDPTRRALAPRLMPAWPCAQYCERQACAHHAFTVARCAPAQCLLQLHLESTVCRPGCTKLQEARPANAWLLLFTCTALGVAVRGKHDSLLLLCCIHFVGLCWESAAHITAGRSALLWTHELQAT